MPHHLPASSDGSLLVAVLVERRRCETSNPCHHECVDTDVAIRCRCYDGFTLQSDGRSCRGTL